MSCMLTSAGQSTTYSQQVTALSWARSVVTSVSKASNMRSQREATKMMNEEEGTIIRNEKEGCHDGKLVGGLPRGVISRMSTNRSI